MAPRNRSPYGTKAYQTRNRTNKNTETPSQIAKRREAREGGRNPNSAYSAGAGRTQQGFGTVAANTKSGYRAVTEREGMIDAWNTGKNVATATSSKTGRMSTNGRTAGGETWTFTDKENGRQSGRSKLATRRQRTYDVKNAFNDANREQLGRSLLDRGLITQDEFNTIYRTSGGGARGLTTG